MSIGKTRQYTIRSIPVAIDRVLRRRAKKERRSLNEVALEALRRGAGLPEQPQVFVDLDDCVGTWKNDPACENAMAEHDLVDPELWR